MVSPCEGNTVSQVWLQERLKSGCGGGVIFLISQTFFISIGRVSWRQDDVIPSVYTHLHRCNVEATCPRPPSSTGDRYTLFLNSDTAPV